MTPFVLAIVALLWLSRHRVVTVSRGAVAERPRTSHDRARPRRSRSALELGDAVRAAVIAVLLLFVLFALPAMLSSYWIDVLTQRRHLLDRGARPRTC